MNRALTYTAPSVRAAARFAGFFLLCAACGDASVDRPQPQSSSPPTSVPSQRSPFEGHPELPREETIEPKSPRRLSVSQLERSLDVIAGLPSGSVQLPPNLALTLGRPDFQTVTQRSFEPSPLFMKFMIDLGAFVCGTIWDVDASRPVEQRVLDRPVDDATKARDLWFRFTGLEGPEADDTVSRLVEAMDAAGGPPRQRAMALCISAATSPEFLLY